MFETARDDTGTKDDTSVFTMVNAIARLEHGAVAGHGGVEVHVIILQLLAVFATGLSNDWHEATILLAVVADNRVFARW